ncbi:MAG TPA: hypothetical protein VE398_05690 [Acidobacteriota bacterium]|nr:hypothetical protein [Acidobacteriota bacterium]
MMRRHLYTGLLVFVIALLALALAAPNFSGTWVRDKTQSDPMMGGRGGGQAMDMEVTLTIKQDGNNFEVATQRGERNSEAKYTLDGKENKNSTGRGETISKSRVEGDKLLIEGVRKMTRQSGETMEMKFSEEYSLSADGKVLTVKSTATTPQGERTSKQVYNKK